MLRSVEHWSNIGAFTELYSAVQISGLTSSYRSEKNHWPLVAIEEGCFDCSSTLYLCPMNGKDV